MAAALLLKAGKELHAKKEFPFCFDFALEIPEAYLLTFQVKKWVYFHSCLSTLTGSNPEEVNKS